MNTGKGFFEGGIINSTLIFALIPGPNDNSTIRSFTSPDLVSEITLAVTFPGAGGLEPETQN